MTKAWRAAHRKDFYYRKAKKEHYRSRASYKLKQLDFRYALIEQGDVVVDLGASPGGWSQVAVEMAGSESKVFAVDIDRFAPIEGVTFIRGDIRDASVVDRLLDLVPEGADVVLSDMSPNISGNYSYDHARSVELCEHALAFAVEVLKPGGNFVAKMFSGDMGKPFTDDVRRRFGEFHTNHPRASRAASSEVYVIGLGFRPPRR
ncbi:MAG: rRNA (uridine2552-2-O)-methyltransferase [Candidatus Thermoplasmatota archaeon]|nr:rRNA (uridine2552-2-O)-methyltransferase [Candidatus Thermoplasmatota archaeon]